MSADVAVVAQAVEQTLVACQSPAHSPQLVSITDVIRQTVAGKARADLLYYTQNGMVATMILGMFAALFTFLFFVTATGGGSNEFPGWLLVTIAATTAVGIIGAVRSQRRLPSRMKEHGIVGSGQTGYRWTVDNNGSDITVTLFEISRGVKPPVMYAHQEQCLMRLVHQEVLPSATSAAAYMDAVNLSINISGQQLDRVTLNHQIEQVLTRHQITPQPAIAAAQTAEQYDQ